MALVDGLVSYWSMDEASTGVAAVTRNDSHGTNHLTDNNTTASAAGKISNGADFEASNSEVLNISDASQSGLDLGGNFSISFWFNSESIASFQAAISKQDADSGTGINYVFFLFGSDLYFRRGDNTAIRDAIDTTTAYASATWYHAVGTFSTANGMRLYVNGSQVATQGSTAASPTTSTNFNIGRRSRNSDTTHDAYFDGIIDEVGVWSRELTSAEVTSLYNSGSAFAYPFSGGATYTSSLMMMGVGT